VRVEDESLRAQFDALSLAEDEALTMVLYSRADSWLGWDQSRERDHPVRSFARIVRLAFRGLRHSILPGGRSRDGSLVTSIAPLVIAAALLPAWVRATGQEPQTAATGVAAPQQAKQATEQAKSEQPKPEQAKPEQPGSSKKAEGVSGPAQDHPATKPVTQADAADKPVPPTATVQKTAPPAAENKVSKTAAQDDDDDEPAPAKPIKSIHPVAKTIASAVSTVAASAKFVLPAPARPTPVATEPATTADNNQPATIVESPYAEYYRERVLPVWWRMCGLAAQYPWGLLILVVLQTFLMAVLLRASLRRRARERLLGHI
jgi:hypothetical protein